MTTWHWIRHGPTHQKSFVGWRDVPADLSDTAHIARLNAHLPDQAIVIASDLIRASATADVLSDGRTRLPDSIDLREFHFGDWDGRHFTEVAETHPELSRAYWETPGDIAPPGGESWNESATRVARVVDAMNAEYAGQHIVAVAHFGVILTQVQRALGINAAEVLVHKIDTLSVTDMRFDGTDWHLGRINHLP